MVISRSRFRSSWPLPCAALTEKASVLLVVLHDRAAVGAGEPDRVADDAVQHRVGVEARAHRVAHLSQCLELVHLAGQLGAASLERLHQVDLAQRDRRLCRELVQQTQVALAERGDLGPPHRQHAHHVVAQQHRRRQEGAEAGHALEVRPAVLRVGEDVFDLLRVPVQGDPAGQSGPGPLYRVVGHVAAELLGDVAGDPGQPVDVSVEEIELRDVGTAQPSCPVDDGVEDLLGAATLAPQCLQDLAAGQRLLAGVAERLFEAVRCRRSALLGPGIHLLRGGLLLLGHRHPPWVPSIMGPAFRYGNGPYE